MRVTPGSNWSVSCVAAGTSRGMAPISARTVPCALDNADIACMFVSSSACLGVLHLCVGGRHRRKGVHVSLARSGTRCCALMDRTGLVRYVRPLARIDKALALFHVALLVIGCVFLYGAGQEVGGDFSRFWLRQLRWAALGSIAFAVVVCIDYHLLERWCWVLYGLGIALLLTVHFAGVTINNARSWLEIPVVGLRIQPAEMAKPSTILAVSWLASKAAAHTVADAFVFPVLLTVAIPILLISLQPDWGTAFVYVPLALAIVFAAGLRWRWILTGVLLVSVAIPLSFPELRDHQKNRIKVFLEPPYNVAIAVASPVLPDRCEQGLRESAASFFERAGIPLDTDWNSHQSMLAVGSGGRWGKGFMNGTQHVLGFLPRTVAPTDFIFSVIAEEAGFAGACGVVCIFALLIACCFRIASRASDRFGALVAVGVATVFFTHAYINIGMTIQAAPIIGIPLPFVSYGGSFMLSTMICAGLVQSVHVWRREPDE